MNHPVLKLQDVCNNNPSKINDNEFLIDTTEIYSEDYEKILKHLRPIKLEKDWKEIDVTVLDLFNIPLKEEKEIIEFIYNRLGIDITSERWIEQINNIFEIAKQVYEERYLKLLPVKLKKLHFKNTRRIIDFLKQTKINRKTWLLNCAIAKISYAVHDIINNEKIRRNYFLDKTFIKEYLERPFQLEEAYTDKDWNEYITWKVVINNSIIKFKMISRQKTKFSIIWKEIADPKYYSTEEFKDLVWITIYVDSEIDAIKMMQYIDQMIYKWTAQISNKNAIQEQDIKNSWVNKEFEEKIKKSININNKKESTSKTYREVKLIWNVDLPIEEWKNSSRYSIWTEIKFVIWWHDNEKWLSLHAIYDYQKRFRELTRLWIPIRKLDIINYINDFFHNIDKILMKKNKEKNSYYIELFNDLKEWWFIWKDKKLNWNIISNEKILALWLYNFYLSKLKKIRLKWWKHTFYVDKRALLLRDFSMHKNLEEV